MAEKVDQPTSSDALGKDNGSGPKAIIKNVDMSEEMQQEAVDVASAALEKYNIEKDIAAQIKKEFDKRHGPTWHVVVGKNFGSYVTHGEHLLPRSRRPPAVRFRSSVPRCAPACPVRSSLRPQKRSTSSTSTSARSPSSSGSHEQPRGVPDPRRFLRPPPGAVQEWMRSGGQLVEGGMDVIRGAQPALIALDTSVAYPQRFWTVVRSNCTIAPCFPAAMCGSRIAIWCAQDVCYIHLSVCCGPRRPFEAASGTLAQSGPETARNG